MTHINPVTVCNLGRRANYHRNTNRYRVDRLFTQARNVKTSAQTMLKDDPKSEAAKALLSKSRDLDYAASQLWRHICLEAESMVIEQDETEAFLEYDKRKQLSRSN